MTIHDHATRLTAQVAPFLDAIKSARAGGLMWGDIGGLLGIKSGDALRQAVKKCRYVADQVPLPEPRPDKPVVKGAVVGAGQVGAPAPGRGFKDITPKD